MSDTVELKDALVVSNNQTGVFGSSAGQFAEGNDSRLSDAREPTSHDNTKHSTNYEPELNADQKRKITYGTADPTGGSDGDIYLQYED